MKLTAFKSFHTGFYETLICTTIYTQIFRNQAKWLSHGGHNENDVEAQTSTSRCISKTQQTISRFHSLCAPVVCSKEASDSSKKVKHGSQETCLDSRQAPNPTEIQHFMRFLCPQFNKLLIKFVRPILGQRYEWCNQNMGFLAGELHKKRGFFFNIMVCTGFRFRAYRISYYCLNLFFGSDMTFFTGLW